MGAERSATKPMDPGKAFTWPLGLGLGAAVGYFLDPENGKRRRRLLKDKARHYRRIGASNARKALADAENRVRGVVAEVRSRVGEEGDVPDDLLEQRVRSRLGHLLTHPRAVEVTVEQGFVTLTGAVLESEVDHAIRDLRTLPGVHRVEDRLERFESSEDVPSLQGGRERRGRRFFGTGWSPAYRLAGMTASLPLLGWGLRQRGAAGGVLAGLGASLFARSLLNQPLSKLIGVGADADVIELRKHLSLEGTPEDVFSELRDPERICELLTQVESVSRSSRPNCWEVTVSGPAGLPLRFDVEVVDVVPNRHIAWRSVEGARVPMEGSLHLTSAEGGGTELDLDLRYNPPGGLLGEALATLFGASLRQGFTTDIPRIQRALRARKRPTEGLTAKGEESGEARTKGGNGGGRSRIETSELKTGGEPSRAPESGA